MKAFCLAAVSAGLVALALVIPAGAPASYPAPAQRLVVMSEALFGPGIALMDERGNVSATLSSEPGLNGGIAVSRRGTKFAYVQTIGFDFPPEVPADVRRRFARLPRSMLQLGSFLRDVRLPGVGSVNIFSSSRVTAAAPGRPAWSPNGRRIVFARARLGKVHLFAIPGDLSQLPRQLTRSPGRDLNPRWSPDGRSIVFERHVAGGADLYSIAPDGSDLRRLTYWRGRELWPDFSPDGRSLVFSSDATGRFQLYVMPVGASFPKRLTFGFGDDRRPVWSPDARWIAFSSDRDGDDDVYLIAPDGGRERKLTHNASQDLVQEWQPLRDARPPLVRALPSSGPRGRPAQLRYTLSDESAYVRVEGEVHFGGGGADRGAVSSSGLRSQVVRTRGGRTHVLRVPRERLLPFSLEDDLDAEPPLRFRFCLLAVDPWGNGSALSCATFRFR
jgi:dipeptidyl aminopeptidase/acylaminoacyl peptidase